MFEIAGGILIAMAALTVLSVLFSVTGFVLMVIKEEFELFNERNERKTK